MPSKLTSSTTTPVKGLVYGNVKEELPPDMPKPLGKTEVMT